jgi:site-specific DNA-methyltransferase (adenine-specific)
VTGFTDAEIARLRGGGREDLDDVPEPPAKPVTRPGDVWTLGPHRLLCGDATSADDVARLLGDEKPFLMVTDPPYGVSYDPTWRVAAGVSSRGAARGRVANDDRSDWREAWALFPGAVAYVWHGGLHAASVAGSLVASGFEIRAQLVWVKQRPVLSRGAYHWQHEPAYVGVRGGAPDRWVEEHDLAAYAVREGEGARWDGGRRQSTVWEIEHRANASGHGTEKPVECMARPMRNHGGRGDAVYEPFCGSGTSIVAAETTGRRCFALELTPAYCDVAVERWQTITGGEARRELSTQR